MSLIDLEDAKSFLDVIHEEDDSKLQMLLDGAEDEAVQFMDISGLDELLEAEVASEVSSEQSTTLPASVFVGVMLLLQLSYQTAPEKLEMLRKAAETKLMPYRKNLGV